MKNIEKQKEELKEQISLEIDRYYEEIAEGLKRKSLKIEEIERLLKEKKTKVNELLIKSAGEAMGENESEKKTVQSVDE